MRAGSRNVEPREAPTYLRDPLPDNRAVSSSGNVLRTYSYAWHFGARINDDKSMGDGLVRRTRQTFHGAGLDKKRGRLTAAPC